MSEPLGKISIVLYLGKPRNGTIEFLPSGVGDFTILYSPGVRFYICLVAANSYFVVASEQAPRWVVLSCYSEISI